MLNIKVCAKYQNSAKTAFAIDGRLLQIPVV
jgi:hypothetical protein